MEQPPVSEFKSTGGFRRIIAAFVNSIDGFRAAWRNEYALRQEVLVTIVANVLALLLPASASHIVFLLSGPLLVCRVEIINYAIEALEDRISLERRPLSKRANELGSAAVALSITIAVLA